MVTKEGLIGLTGSYCDAFPGISEKIALELLKTVGTQAFLLFTKN